MEYDRAIADFNEAIRLDPKSEPAYLQPRPRLAREEGTRQGDRRLQRGDPARPQGCLAYLNRGDAWRDKKEYDKAIADYNEAIRLDPKDAVAYFNRGDAWVRQEGVRQGDRRLQRGHPARSQGRRGLRQPRHRLVRKKEYDKAIADFNEAIRLDPKYAVGLHQPGAPGATRRSTTRPSPTSTRPSGSIPRTPRLHQPGVAWCDKKEYDKAIADFNEAIRLDPKNAIGLHATAATPGTTRRNTTRRSPTTTRPSGSTPSTPWPTATAARLVRQEGVRQGDRRLQRGHPARSQGRRGLQQPRHRLARQEGIRQGDRRLSTRPSGSIPRMRCAYNNRGIAWVDKKEYDKAIADFNEAIRLDPKDADAYTNRGYAWYAKKEYDKAIADFTRPSGSIPSTRKPIPLPGATLGMSEKDGLRQSADRLRTSYPARSQTRRCIRGCAWLLGDLPGMQVSARAERPIASATTACELTDWKDACPLGSLAAAYQARRATSTRPWRGRRRRMCHSEAPEDKRKGVDDRLKLYLGKSPYREVNP